MSEYIKKIVKAPLLCIKRGFEGIQENILVIGELDNFKGYRDILKSSGSFITSVYTSGFAHELLHNVASLIISGNPGKLLINPLYGGEVLHKLFPGFIETENLPFYQPAISLGLPSNNLGHVMFSTFPALVLVPLGVYMVKDGIKRKSPIETGIGASLSLHTLFSMTDFTNALYFASKALTEGPFVNSVQQYSNGIEPIPYVIGGLVLVGFTYKGIKKAVNYLMDRHQKKEVESTTQQIKQPNESYDKMYSSYDSSVSFHSLSFLKNLYR